MKDGQAKAVFGEWKESLVVWRALSSYQPE